jgi:tetratricopeptide (TPR) repeat protein
MSGNGNQGTPEMILIPDQLPRSLIEGILWEQIFLYLSTRKGKHLYQKKNMCTMDIVSPRSAGKKTFPALFIALLIGTACFTVISPVSAEIGYTQKWICNPAWMTEQANSSQETDLYKIIQQGIDSNARVFTLINKGKEYLRGGSYLDADDSFSQAASLNPDQFDARLGHALVLERMKRYQGALDAYEFSIGLVNEHKNAWIPLAGKGRCLLETQKYQDAVGVFQLAIEKFVADSTDNEKCLINLYESLADAYEKSDQKSEAEDAMKKADELRT